MNKILLSVSALVFVIGAAVLVAPDAFAANERCIYKGDCTQMNCTQCPPGPAGGWCCVMCPNGGSEIVERCEGVAVPCDPDVTGGGCGESQVGTCNGHCGNWSSGGDCNQDTCQ